MSPAIPRVSPRILVDADACPVKNEIYRVAARYSVPVSIVSNSPFRVPVGPLVERIVVSDGFDAADDWIAERAEPANGRHHRGHSPRRTLPQSGRSGSGA